MAKKISFSSNILLLLFVWVFFSCTTKQSCYDELVALRMEAYTNHSVYTADQWADFADRNIDLIMQMDELDYTPAEWREIGKVQGQIAGYMAESTILHWMEMVNNVLQLSIGFKEGFKEAFDVNGIENNAHEIEQAFKSF